MAFDELLEVQEGACEGGKWSICAISPRSSFFLSSCHSKKSEAYWFLCFLKGMLLYDI